MDYSKLSDFEINKRVADIAMNGTWHVKPSHPDNDTGGWIYGSNGIQTYDLPDYCNNPSDAWPIIEKYRISFLDQLTEWCVDAKGVSPVFEANPLRGAMIVFLMMQDSANVQDNQS
ncbi:TPA: phage protein NinX family protein [Citrobacter freundii]